MLDNLKFELSERIDEMGGSGGGGSASIDERQIKKLMEKLQKELD